MLADWARTTTNSSRLSPIVSMDLTGYGGNFLALVLADLAHITGFNWLNRSTAATLGPATAP